MLEKTIQIKVLSFSKSDLLMAISEDLPGLVVHTRSSDELESRLPQVVRDLLEADGFNVDNVTVERESARPVPPEFRTAAYIASASLRGQAA